MKNIYLDDATVDQGRFLFWSWEQWRIGGGSGVLWFFLWYEISPGRYSPLWWIYKLQRRRK